MKICKELGGRLIEDKYGMRNPLANETSCTNIEERVGRLDIFGPTKTFRDTSECRDMVYDYVW